jgi:hypothetical protein
VATNNAVNVGLSGASGTGNFAGTTSPVFVTPTLGAASATSINKVAFTAPLTSATLALADGSSLTTAGAFASTFTFTNTTSVTFPTSGTLATTTQIFPFSNVSGTTQAAAVNNGYIIGNAGQTTVTLPATAAVGDRVSIVGNGAAGWILTANTGQTIKVGTATTSSGGTVTSAAQYDQIEVCCTVANTTWVTRFVLSAGVTPA